MTIIEFISFIVSLFSFGMWMVEARKRQQMREATDRILGERLHLEVAVMHFLQDLRVALQKGSLTVVEGEMMLDRWNHIRLRIYRDQLHQMYGLAPPDQEEGK